MEYFQVMSCLILFLMCEKDIERKIDKDLIEKVKAKDFALLTIHRESNTKKKV